MSGRAGSTGALARTQAVPACGVEKALLARRRMRGSTMLSWEKIDAIPGWFMFQSYCVWRALLDQQAQVTGDLFEIGVWRGRSASLLASYRKGDEKLYLCDLRLDEPAVHKSMRTTGIEPANLVPLSGPSADLPAKLDLKAMHQTVRWLHIDGEHTGTAVYRELEFANRIVNTDG